MIAPTRRPGITVKAAPARRTASARRAEPPSADRAVLGRDRLELASLMKTFRAPGTDRETFDISLADVIGTFAGRTLPKGALPAEPRLEPEIRTSALGKQIAFQHGDLTVLFEANDRDAQAILKADPKALDGLVKSVLAKLDGIVGFYRRLVVEAGGSGERFDERMPKSVTFNLIEGGWQYGANADHGTITLGYKFLLNDFGAISTHEASHLVAKTMLGKNKVSTALNEGLADYFAAVAHNQPALGKPASRRVKNHFTEAKDGSRLAKEGYHEYGQLISNTMWQLRKAVNHRLQTPWSEVSYADKLALHAHHYYTNETFKSPQIKLPDWLDALTRADAELSGGAFADLIRNVGSRVLGR